MVTFALQLPHRLTIAELHEQLTFLESLLADSLLPRSDSLMAMVKKLPALRDARLYWSNCRRFPSDGQLLILMLMLATEGTDRMLDDLQVLVCSMSLSESETRMLRVGLVRHSRGRRRRFRVA